MGEQYLSRESGRVGCGPRSLGQRKVGQEITVVCSVNGAIPSFRTTIVIDSRQAPVTVTPLAFGHHNRSFLEKPNCLSTMLDFTSFLDTMMNNGSTKECCTLHCRKRCLPPCLMFTDLSMRNLENLLYKSERSQPASGKSDLISHF